MKFNNPITILVQRRAAIGDVIMTTGVVRELKKQYGDNAVIDVATDNFEVYQNNPHIRNIIPTDGVHPGHYNVYINLDDAYELNPSNHYVDSYFYRAFGIHQTTMNKAVELFPSDADKRKVDEDIAEWDSPYIVVHMRNWHWPAKNITLDVWAGIFERLFNERTDFKIVCVGGPTDFTLEHPLFVDAREKYNSQQLKHLCDYAKCFVGIDSGPFWCAAASKTHIVGLFTHLKAEHIMPHRCLDTNWNSTAICTEESCGGCNERQKTPVRFINCEHNDYRCAGNFNLDRIADAILKQL